MIAISDVQPLKPEPEYVQRLRGRISELEDKNRELEQRRAEMREALETILDDLQRQASGTVDDLITVAKQALSTSCGKGWVSEEEMQCISADRAEWEEGLLAKLEQALAERDQARAEAAAQREMVAILHCDCEKLRPTSGCCKKLAQLKLDMDASGTAAKALLDELEKLRRRCKELESTDAECAEMIDEIAKSHREEIGVLEMEKRELQAENEVLRAVRDAAEPISDRHKGIVMTAADAGLYAALSAALDAAKRG